MVLRDLFFTLTRPHGLSALSAFIARWTWRFGRRLLPTSRLHLAGPIMLTLTVFTWALLLAAGWALVY